MEETNNNEVEMPDMKHYRVVVTRHGGPEVLEVVEEDIPEPQAGEVRVRVLAAGVSAYDIMNRHYSFPGGPAVTFTQGEDIVGVVDFVGEGVSTLESGQLEIASELVTCQPVCTEL